MKFLNIILVIIALSSFSYFVFDIFDYQTKKAHAAPVFFDTPPAPYPQINFNFNPTTPSAGQGVQFQDLTTCYSGVSAGGSPISAPCSAWAWNFGDSGFSPSQNPSHAYSSNGSYNVSSFVSDQLGNSCFLSKPIAVGGSGGPTPSSSRKPIYQEVPPK